MIPPQLILYGVLLLGALGGGWYVVDTWHYEPLREKEQIIKQREDELRKVGEILNKAYETIDKQKAGSVQNYIEAIGEHDENVDSSLDGIST